MAETCTATDYKKFVEIVRQMRHAQKLYFKTRSSEAIDDAKKLERAVDHWIDGNSENDQRKLF